MSMRAGFRGWRLRRATAARGAGHCIGCLVLFASNAAFAASLSFLDPKGSVAAAQRTHFYDIVLLMMVVVLPVLIGTPLVAWRYRYRNRSARYTPNWKFSWPLEVLIWGVPAAVVVVLGIWLWQGAARLDPYKPLPSATAPLKVEVIGYDWKWLFIYPDLHIATMGELAFPAERPLAMRLTTGTVMQSFFIPALGSQIYAMAGMRTKLYLKADKPGVFLGENTQYNGMGFQDQKFTARAMTPEDFRAWVADVRSEGIALTPKVYDAIRARSKLSDVRKAVDASRMPPKVLYLTDISPGLFRNVIQTFHGGPSDTAALLSGMPAPAETGTAPPSPDTHQAASRE